VIKRGGAGCDADGAGGAAGAGAASGVTAAGGAAGGGTSATGGAFEAGTAAPCGARNTAEGGALSVGRGGRLATPPLRLDAAGTERGVPFGVTLFGAPLFGAALGARGARDELRDVASTDSMAAIRSAWVMPDMSTAGTPGAGG
jgi:hypothetical protein